MGPQGQGRRPDPPDRDPSHKPRRSLRTKIAGNANLRARYLARRDALAGGWLNEAERARAFAQFEQAERLYREVLSVDPANARARTGLDTATLQARLLELELDGWVGRLPGGLLQRTGQS